MILDMIEKSEIKFCPDDVRVMSEKVLSTSKDLLTVDSSVAITVLKPKLLEYASQRKGGAYSSPGSELDCSQEIGLNLFMNAINFCYQDPESRNEYHFVSKSGDVVKRATGMLTALAESGVDWNSFAEVEKITPDQWLSISQISETNKIYLGKERQERIVGLAKYLRSLGLNTTTDFFELTDGNALQIVNLLDKSGFFADIFKKRSQLAARMISEVCAKKMDFSLYDIDKLTVMADYRLPQVLYNLGVVVLEDESLLSKLCTGEEILPGSREEIALRASSIVVGKILSESMGKTESEIDGLLWGLSQKMVKNNEMKIPHMIVATDAY
jgi:hypothetical protein